MKQAKAVRACRNKKSYHVTTGWNVSLFENGVIHIVIVCVCTKTIPVFFETLEFEQFEFTDNNFYLMSNSNNAMDEIFSVVLL